MKVSEFKGLLNKEEPLVSGLSYLSKADNVDVDNLGNIRRRDGYKLIQSFPGIYASYTTRDMSKAYVLANNQILELPNLNQVFDGVEESTYLFEDANNTLFVYGKSKLIYNMGEFQDWFVPTPLGIDIEVVPGNLPEGIYQVAISYRNKHGIEAGVSPVRVVHIDKGKALRLRLDQVKDFSTTVYISPVNGKYLYEFINTKNPDVIFDKGDTIIASPLNVDQISAVGVPSGGNSLAYFQGKVFIGFDNVQNNKSVIYYSVQNNPYLFKLDSNYFIIEGNIKAIIDAITHLVVCTTTDIYYYANDILEHKASYGVVSSDCFSRNKDNKLFIFTNKGVCRADSNEFANLTNDVYNFYTASSVSSQIVSRRGFEQLITVLEDADPANNTFK